jgi:hypothetical protein
MSKKLASLMDAVPPALVAAAAAPPPPLPRLTAPPAPAAQDREVPLQITIPRRVRRQLDRLAFEHEETLRAVILRAVRSLGVEVSDDDLKDRRGRRPS